MNVEGIFVASSAGAIPTVILYYRVPNKEHFIKIVKGGQIRKG
jgi:hypothetical protein